MLSSEEAGHEGGAEDRGGDDAIDLLLSIAPTVHASFAVMATTPNRRSPIPNRVATPARVVMATILAYEVTHGRVNGYDALLTAAVWPADRVVWQAGC
jgi:hypothetical protein